MSTEQNDQKAITPSPERLGSACGDFSFDYTSSGHQRVTCKCGKAIVRQPYMKDADWWKTRREFGMNHRPNTGRHLRPETKDGE